MHTDPFKVPETEIRRRIASLQQAMEKHGMDAVFIVQRVDLFYFSGTAQNGCLYVPGQGEPMLFIRKYMPRAEKESPIRRKAAVRSIKEVPGLIVDTYGKLPDVLGFEFDVMPVREFRFYRRLFDPGQCVDASLPIHEVRMIKSHWDVAQMERTAEISRKTFAYIQRKIRPGLTEIEFAGIYETYARKMGHGAGLRVRDYQGEVYNWHILSGKSGAMVGLLDSPASGTGTSAAFPCGGSHKLLAPNEPIMIDMATVKNGYHMDETRMFAIDTMPDTARDACRAVIDIHDTVLEKAKPGICVGELYQAAVQRAAALGYGKAFLGPPGYKVTFIGHGVGLELVEPPFIAKGKKDRMQPGMTFALEPKMVFENRYSIGVESVFLVTDTGTRLLSKVPVAVFVC